MQGSKAFLYRENAGFSSLDKGERHHRILSGGGAFFFLLDTKILLISTILLLAKQINDIIYWKTI